MDALQTCIAGLLVFLSPGICAAQPAFYFQYRDVYEAKDSPIEVRLDGLFRMIDAAFHYDLDLAIKHSRETIAEAKNAGLQDAEAAGYMDLATWTAYKYDSSKSVEFFKKAQELFNPQGDPRFLIHYYSARFSYSMVNEDSEYDPNQFLINQKAMADELDDPYYQMGYLYMAATSKVFLGKLPPTEPEILELRRQLKKIEKEQNYHSAKLNGLLLDAKEASLAGNDMSALLYLARTVEHATKHKFPLFALRAKLVLTNIEAEMTYESFVDRNGPVDQVSDAKQEELQKQLSPIRTKYEECLSLARQVKMSAYIFESLINSAFVEFHGGNVDRAKELIIEADNLPYDCFRSWVLRDTLYRYAVMIFTGAGDKKKAVHYANLLGSKEHSSKVAEASEKWTRYAQRLTTVVQEKEIVERTKDVTESKLVASQDEASRWKTALIYSLLGIGLLLVSGALVLSRNRLKQVSSELFDEKESLRINLEIQNVLQDRVNRLQRMESLGMLAGGIAHDFNNLLVGVMGNAEILELGNENLDDFSQERLQQIIDSAEKAADLSKQMLAYAGKQQIQRRALNVNDIVKNMSRVLTVSVGENRELQFELDSDPLISQVDETQIEQVLLNLVNNSRDATSNNGKIIIRTGRETISEIKKDSTLHGTREEGGDFVYVDVIDTGCGFGKGQVERIFEPFYSTRESGRGLGLSVVYGIVNGHEGLIRANSKPDRGTTFRILLPESDSSTYTKTMRPGKPHMAGIEKSEGLVLVADDEPTVRNLAQALLESNGYQVVLAEDGERAIEILNNSGKRVQCCLLDVVMPQMGACEVLERLAKDGNDVPVILMTGYSDTQLEDYRKNKRVLSILSKPFRAMELLSAVNLAIPGATKRNRIKE